MSSLPLVSLSDYPSLPQGKEQYDPEYIQAQGVLKLVETPTEVTIGCRDNTTEAVMEQLIHYHDKKIHFVQVGREEFSLFLANLFSGNSEKTHNIETDEADALDRLANDAPIINLVNSIIMDGLNRGASDIHLEAFDAKAQVRYRQDGKLVVGREFPVADFPAVSSRLKIMADLNIVETRRPQDGRLSVYLGERKVDIRVSVVPIVRGESLVLRILNRNASQLLTLEELGFLEKDAEGFRSMYGKLNGLVLVTGPTGSGKTTTLNAALRELNTPDRKIITIEDPVEYVLDGIDQIQTHEKIGLTFESILRRVLRQDPDIIMVGEIRDKETAELAIRAALTGHLVFATLHTNDAVSAVNRLINMGVPAYLLASVLRGALSQRLARRNCQDCLDQEKITPSLEYLCRKYKLKKDRLRHGRGCKACNGRGEKGRVALLEWFTVDRKVEEMIVNSEGEHTIRDYLESEGMTTFINDGLEKIRRGLLSAEEWERMVLL